MGVVCSGGIHWNELQRRTAFGYLDSSPTSSDVSLAAELGRRWEYGPLSLTPTASLAATYLFQDAYNESNVDAGAMRLDGDDVRSLRGVLGARLDYLARRANRDVLLEIQAGWMHEYLDDEQHFVGSLLGNPAATDLWFSGPDRDALYGGAGLVVALEEGTTLSTRYFGLISGNNQEHAGLVSLTITF